MRDFVISLDLRDRLLADVAAAPDAEICGLLFGEQGRIASAVATRNVAVDPRMQFEIDPVALIAAHKAQRQGGPRLIGCYHSHPGGRAIPSATDAAAAEPGSLWLLLAGDQARLWRAVADGFDEINLIFVRLVP